MDPHDMRNIEDARLRQGEPKEYNDRARGRRSSDSTLWCAAPFGNCTEWFQDSRRSSFRGAIINGWTRDKQHLWLCPACSEAVRQLRIDRAVADATPSIERSFIERLARRADEVDSGLTVARWEEGDILGEEDALISWLTEWLCAQPEAKP